MTSSGTSHGPRRRPREATSTTPCRSGTTIGPNSARTGAVHRSSAQSRPTGPRAVRAHPFPAGTAATGATHHDRRRKINDGVRRRRRARAAGAPHCYRYPVVEGGHRASNMSASFRRRRGPRHRLRHRRPFLRPRRRTKEQLFASSRPTRVLPVSLAEVSSPATGTRAIFVRLSIARLLVPPGPRQGAVAAHTYGAGAGAVPEHATSLLRRARLRGACRRTL